MRPIADSDDLTISVIIGKTIHGFCGSGCLSDDNVILRRQTLNL